MVGTSRRPGQGAEYKGVGNPDLYTREGSVPYLNNVNVSANRLARPLTSSLFRHQKAGSSPRASSLPLDETSQHHYREELGTSSATRSPRDNQTLEPEAETDWRQTTPTSPFPISVSARRQRKLYGAANTQRALPTLKGKAHLSALYLVVLRIRG